MPDDDPMAVIGVALDKLAISNDKLTAAVLSYDRDARRSRRKLLISNVLLLAGVIVFGLLQGYSDHTVYQTQQDIRSCVQVNGSCYHRNQESDAGTRNYLAAVGQQRLALANENSVAAASCGNRDDIRAIADDGARYKALLACVKAVLRAQPMPSISPAPTAPPSGG